MTIQTNPYCDHCPKLRVRCRICSRINTGSCHECVKNIVGDGHDKLCIKCTRTCTIQNCKNIIRFCRGRKKNCTIFLDTCADHGYGLPLCEECQEQSVCNKCRCIYISINRCYICGNNYCDFCGKCHETKVKEKNDKENDLTSVKDQLKAEKKDNKENDLTSIKDQLKAKNPICKIS